MIEDEPGFVRSVARLLDHHDFVILLAYLRERRSGLVDQLIGSDDVSTGDLRIKGMINGIDVVLGLERRFIDEE